MGGRLFMIHVVLCGHGECVELSCHVVTIITLWSVWSYHVVVMYCGHCVVISCCGHIVLWSVCGHKTLRSHYIVVTVWSRHSVVWSPLSLTMSCGCRTGQR